MKLYYDLMSQPSRALYIFLTKSGIPFTKCPVALRKGEHKTLEYTKIHPFQLVPALDDDGFKLTESIAILRYLCKKFKETVPKNWYPDDMKLQAKVDEYLEWQHNNTRLSCAMYFQHKLVIPLLTQMPPSSRKVAQFQERMETNLEHFESIWLKNSPFIVGDNLSLADLLAICELQQPSIVGYNVCEGRPKLSSWFDRVKQELQPQFDEASNIVYKFTEMYSKGLIEIPKAQL